LAKIYISAIHSGRDVPALYTLERIPCRQTAIRLILK